MRPASAGYRMGLDLPTFVVCCPYLYSIPEGGRMKIESPYAGQPAGRLLMKEGLVPGTWYMELQDGDGNEIAYSDGFRPGADRDFGPDAYTASTFAGFLGAACESDTMAGNWCIVSDDAAVWAEHMSLLYDAPVAGDWRTPDWCDEAYSFGRGAGRNAASWLTINDGHMARRLLTMLNDGDPAVYDYLPEVPNLSGEWADAPTPVTLWEEVTPFDWRDNAGEIVDAICEAWERGVREGWQDEVECILHDHAESVDGDDNG